MKIIRESLSFERGQSPKSSMGVGKIAKIAQIKSWLDEMEVEDYTINDDFTIDVNGSVYLYHKNLNKLPSFIKFGKVRGGFDCSYNQLTSLEGSPASVGEYFSCYHNRLSSLEGAPKSVGAWFSCHHNRLSSLEGAPKSVGAWFSCSYNQLTSLEGAPESVGENFYCQNNIIKFTKKDVQKVCKVKKNH